MIASAADFFSQKKLPTVGKPVGRSLIKGINKLSLCLFLSAYLLYHIYFRFC